MAEGVPPDRFGDPHLRRNRPYDFAHDLLSHIGSSAFRFGAGKDPVFRPVVSHLLTPCPQCFRETGVERDGLLGRFRFAGAGHLPSVVTPKPANGGQGKTGQREEAGDSVVLSCSLLWKQVYFRAPTPRTAFEYVTMMEEAIEHGGDGGAVSQQFAPVFHWSV